jgi:nucleoside-diphosphate-sugar epimerase
MHTILGINGSTGVEIAKNLIEKGIKVRGVSRRAFLGDWEHVQADVLDKVTLSKAVEGSTVVYCCIGLVYDIKIWRRDWPIVIENIIESCLAINAKLVFVDNVYMYGLVEGTMTEETPMNPTSEKGKVRKIVSEKLLDAFKNRGLKGCIARSADFYGPDCPNSMFTETILKNVLAGKTMQWLGRLDKKHAFTYIPDIGRACVNLGTTDAANGQVWHLPTSAAMKGSDFTNKIAAIVGVKPKTMVLRGIMLSILALFIPVLKEFKEMMYQFDEDYLFSSDKYETFFKEKPTSYEKGLETTLSWYKENLK